MNLKFEKKIDRKLWVVLLVVLAPLMVWGVVSCGNKNAVPVAPSGSIGLNVSVQTSGASKAALLGATANEVYYNITGPAMSPVTGVSGPITTAGSTGTINLSIAVPQGSARLMAFQINDASTHLPLALGAVQTDVSSQPTSQVVIEMGSLVRNCYNQNTSSFVDGSYFNVGNGILADAITVVSPTNYDIQFVPTSGVFQMNALNSDTLTYMGNGNLVSFAMAPSSNGTLTASGAAKQAAGAAVTQLQAGDVFLLYIPNPNARIWVQITNVGSSTVGPSFVFRGNTTLPYYAYQQTPADLAGPCATPIPTPAVNYTYTTQWGTYGPNTGQFMGLWAIALDSSGNVYTTDTTKTSSNIQVFTPSGTLTTQWMVTGAPEGIGVDLSGNVYVSEFNNNYVEKYSSTGTLINQVGVGQLSQPRGLAVDSSGNIYVCDGNNSRVAVFNSTGTLINQFGSNGSGNGQFIIPFGIALDSTGNIYVTDGNNYRVEKFNSTGTYLTQWGSNGTGNGQFNNAYGVATDSVGNVYVADRANYRVQKFNSNGVYLTQWGTNGAGNGQLNQPTDLILDPSGNVYVADAVNNRVEVFAP